MRGLYWFRNWVLILGFAITLPLWNAFGYSVSMTVDPPDED